MERRQAKVIPAALLACALLLAVCGSAPGQVSISPTILEPKAYPGGLSTFTLSIGNSGDQTLDCTVQVFALEVAGGGLPLAVEDAPRSCKDWLTVEPTQFELKPKGGERLVCRVQPPRGVAGGYYAVISCHAVPRAAREEEAGGEGVRASVTFSHRVMAVVLLTIPAPQLQAVIEAGQPLIREGEGGRGFALDVPVRNRGNIHARMSGTVDVRSEAGQVVQRFDLEAGRGFILPDHERLFQTKGTVNLPDGFYVARISLNAEGFRRPMEKVFPFHVSEGKASFTELTEELRQQIEKRSAGFTVSPLTIGARFRAGARRTEAVELVNLTKDALTLRASLTEWYRSPEGVDLVLEGEAPHGRSGRELVSLREETIELRPLSRRRVPLTIALAAEAKGERYVAVTFDRADTQLDASPQARARRSVLIGVHAQGTGTPGAEVKDFQAVRKPNGAVGLAVRFRNTGDVLVEPDVTFYIEDKDGNTVGKVSPTVGLPFVQAGGEGIVSAEWTQVLDPGKYAARVSFRYAPDRPPLSQRAEFVVPEPVGPAPEPVTPAPPAERTQEGGGAVESRQEEP